MHSALIFATAMTLQQLEYLVSLDHHRHFGRAAEASGVTQPTLTMQIRKLEEDLGAQLFDRSRQPVRPTELGEKVISQARIVLRESAQVHALIEEMGTSLSGNYGIGVIHTLAPYLMPLFLPRFAERHPDVRLVIDERKTSRILEALRSGELDIGIVVAPIEGKDLELHPLFDEPFLAYLPKGHALWTRQRISRSDLKNQALWVLGEGHCFRDQALSLCEHPSAGGHANVMYESGSIETLKQLVRHGEAMTLVPELSVMEGDPHMRRFQEPQPVRQVCLVTRRPFARVRLIEALSDAIRNALKGRLPPAASRS